MQDDHTSSEILHRYYTMISRKRPQKIYTDDRKSYLNEFKEVLNMVAERLALDEVIQWDEGEYQHLKSLKRQKTKVEI